MKRFFIAITNNPVSLLGVAITTSAALVVLALLAMELVGFGGNPYIGILTYLILPTIFVLGLLLIPWGILRARRHGAPTTFPVLDLNDDRTRRLALTFGIMTLANLVILATATYKGVEVMESTEFCGTTCHDLMQPEYTAYQRSPHSRVKCVECHIGPGASWFAKSKLSGAWQVVSTTLDLYPRPIPTPVHALRPARETCEQCHWPSKFAGDQLKVLTRYASDEANTETKTVLLMKIGGIQGGESQGIHWHVDPANRIRYRSDLSRETIHEVELTTADGHVKRYSAPEAPAGGQWRDMDCVDCHNRPTHVYQLPRRAVDRALDDGRIATTLPWVKSKAVELLEQEYTSHDEARQRIAQALAAYYRDEHPDVYAAAGEAVREAGRVLGEIWSSNVFPSMKVGWGTYPDHIGHEDFTGCFRCHNDEHATEEGETISQDCFQCHSLLAMEEEDPEVLSILQP